MNKHLKSILFLSAFISGCNISKFNAEKEMLLPDSYRKVLSNKENNVSVDWWRVYSDPVLTKLVDQVLERNPYKNFGELHVAEGKSGVDLAKSELLPSINFGLSRDEGHTSSNTPLGEVLQGGSIAGKTNRIGTNSSWQIDLWGRINQSVELSKARLGVAEATRRSVSLILAREVAVAYWLFRSAAADYELLSRMRREQLEAIEIIKSRQELGLNTEQDLLNENIKLARIEDELNEAVVKRDMNEQELATLMAVDVKDFRVETPRDYSLPDIPEVSPGVPAIILSRRPDLIDSSARLRALIAQEKIAETAFYPSISLTSRYGFASQDLSDILKNSSREFSFVPISLSLPIFDGGKNKANLEIARLRYQQQVNVHKVNILIALRQVDDGLTQVQSAKERLRLLGDAVVASGRRVNIAEARYSVGQNNYLIVNTEKNEFFSLQRKMLKSKIDGLMATTYLIEALGGGWDDKVPVDDLALSPKEECDSFYASYFTITLKFLRFWMSDEVAKDNSCSS